MALVFISHSNRNVEQAARIQILLRERNFDSGSLDFDKHAAFSPQSDWGRTLAREIARADAVLLVITADWLESDWCLAELTHALALNKPIVPLLEDPIHGFEVETKVLDLRKDRAAGLEQLIDEMTRIVGTTPINAVGPVISYDHIREMRQLLEELYKQHALGGKPKVTRRTVLAGGTGIFGGRVTRVAKILGLSLPPGLLATSAATATVTLKDLVAPTQVILPTEIDALLGALTDQGNGNATLSAGTKNLGFLELQLTPPSQVSIPYQLTFATAPAATDPDFLLELRVSQVSPIVKLFSFISTTVGAFLKPATYTPPPAGSDEQILSAGTGIVQIVDTGISLLIQGKAGQVATLHLAQESQPGEPTKPPGIVTLRLNPAYFFLGDSSFGLGLPDGITIDTSDLAKAPGQSQYYDPPSPTAADSPPWQGLVIRSCQFFIPKSVPYLGAHVVDSSLEIGMGKTPGIDLVVKTNVPPSPDGRLGIDVRIECHDPTAQDFRGFIPTLVETAVTLPIKNYQPDNYGGGIQFLAGDNVIARFRFVRSVADSTTRITLALESDSSEGILSVTAKDDQPINKAIVTAGALATAIIADRQLQDANGTTGLDALLGVVMAAADALTSYFQDGGRLVVHAVELDAEGLGASTSGPFKFRVDYSVDCLVIPIDVGVLSISMNNKQPMRVRNRNVILTLDPNKSGLSKFSFDFGKADFDVEDPGNWTVQNLPSLFDILGTRSGRGSMWLEVDLRFKINLGPVKISGATIRATLSSDGRFSASLRGLDASIDIPAVIKGGGALTLVDGGFEAELDASLIPLNVSASAALVYIHEPDGTTFLLLRLAVDLPAPIPLANTGFGIFGLSGTFGINAKPHIDSNSGDTIGDQLRWDPLPLPDISKAYTVDSGSLTIGTEVVIATLPDLGFSFNTRGGLFLTVPDAAVRVSMLGKVMSPPPKLSDPRPGPGDDIGLAFKGVAVVDPADGVTIALQGSFGIPVLLQATIPLGSHFPIQDPSNWFVYLGADGYNIEDRGLGPARVSVLPRFLDLDANGYFMLRGKGIHLWPRGDPQGLRIDDGFIIAFGFGADLVMGVKDFAWADVHANADILLATRPLTLAGFGNVNGSFNLGPFSLSVDARLKFLLVKDVDPYISARVCAHIDLFFTELEGCATITIGGDVKRTVPAPDVHPLDTVNDQGIISGQLAFLIDDHGRRLASMSEGVDSAPTVWPDCLPNLSFAVAPALPSGTNGVGGTQFLDIATYPWGSAVGPIGNSMLNYTWNLTKVALFDVTDAQPKIVDGPLSAAWQAGRDGNAGQRPQGADLVLLTYRHDVWTDRLADAGASLPNNPIGENGRSCQVRATPQVGWAIGYGANTDISGFLLPASPLNPDPCVSRFTALLTPSIPLLPNLVLGPSTASLLPAPLEFIPAEIMVDPLKLEREFDGELQLGSIEAPTNRPATDAMLRADLRPSAPISDPRIWLKASPALLTKNLSITDDKNHTWTRTETAGPYPDGSVAIRFAPNAAFASVEVQRVSIMWPIGLQLGILALGGLTRAAVDAAALRTKAAQVVANQQKNAAGKYPQQPKNKNDSGTRCMLQPGRTYRLDVEMGWDGTLSEQDDNGVIHVIANGHDTKYNANGHDPTTNRSYFFKTAPVPPPRTPPEPPHVPSSGLVQVSHFAASAPKYGQTGLAQYLIRKVDEFQPEMLVRHFLGYFPVQGEVDRFRDDRVQAYFDAAYVAQLATLYKYDLSLELRRLDGAGPPSLIKLTTSWNALQQIELLKGADSLRAAVAQTSPCPVPQEGATLEATPKTLAPRAWYELYVTAGNIPFDGVSFRTSRWRDANDLLAGIGWPSAGAPAHGDVEIGTKPALTPLVVEGEDSAFELALDKLGLTGWPPPREARTSLIWVKPQPGSASWSCAGVMIESPEPIIRDNRLAFDSLTVLNNPSVKFEMRRFDRSGSRLLILTANTFRPASNTTFKLTLNNKWPGKALGRPWLKFSAPPKPAAGILKVPEVPTFAREF